jgi:hypothetical protein
MKKLAFRQVDVFTAVPFKGNPVAVVLDGDAVSSDGMQPRNRALSYVVAAGKFGKRRARLRPSRRVAAQATRRASGRRC